MPKILRAREAQDVEEERKVRQLAMSRHGPVDWIRRAQIVVSSWEGNRVGSIASQIHCHPQTVRGRLKRFNEEGVEGLGDRARSGRPQRISEGERSLLISLVGSEPPGRLVRERDGELRVPDEQAEAHWTLDALARAAQARGIRIQRSQIRRILLKENVRWRGVHTWSKSTDPDFAPKELRSSASTRNRR
jgi:transposase